MKIAESRVTAQGQISIPADVRKRLGIGPGSVIEWDDDDTGRITVRRSRRFSSRDIQKVLFPEGPPRAHTLKELKAGIEKHIRERYARD